MASPIDTREPMPDRENSQSGYNPNMLPLEKTFVDALLHAVQEPSEETKHFATQSLQDLLAMYQEDTLKKALQSTEKAVSGEG